MNKLNLALALATVAFIGMVGGYFYPVAKEVTQAAFGGTTSYDELDTSVLRVGGTNGTRLALLTLNSCSLIASTFTVTASTTVAMDCAVTGVVPTDAAFAQFGTTTANLLGGWSVAGASASSTAGFITVDVTNGTGANAIIPASIASSTKLIIVRGTATIPGL